MSTYKDYILYNKIGRFLDKAVYFLPYIGVIGVLVFFWNILIFDDIKKIYLIDKSVVSVHTDEETCCTYHISFYYNNETDVIYHHKKQPADIWKQVYFHKNHSLVDVNTGKNGWCILLYIVISFISVLIITLYTDEVFG